MGSRKSQNPRPPGTFQTPDLVRAAEPEEPDQDVGGGAPGARLADELEVLARVPDEGDPTGDQGRGLDEREEPLALLDEPLHDRVQLNDEPLRVQDGCHDQVDEANGHEQGDGSRGEQRLHVEPDCQEPCRSVATSLSRGRNRPR